MSTHESITTAAVPAWTLGWRIQRAMDHAGIAIADLAEDLEVGRSTVSRWMHDQGAQPKRLYLARIAFRCGVDADWLITGQAEEQHPIDPAGQGKPPTKWETTGPDADVIHLRRLVTRRDDMAAAM